MSKTIREQWRDFDELPLLERWISRGALIVGLVVIAAMLVLLARLGFRAYVALWG